MPATQNNTSASGNLNLRAFMMGNSDPGHYGQLTVYQTPQGTTGPANADSYIQSDSTVSKDITLLDQKGSEVLLGNTLMVPVGDAVVYLRPLYVASSTNPLPRLTYVIGVVGQRVVIDSSLSQTLSDILQTTVTTQSGTGNSATGGGSGTGTSTGVGTVPTQVQQYLNTAQSDYQAALAALKNGDLATYQSDITAMEAQIALAQQALKAQVGTSTSTTTTTAPAAKKAKTTSTTHGPDQYPAQDLDDLDAGGSGGSGTTRRHAPIRREKLN